MEKTKEEILKEVEEIACEVIMFLENANEDEKMGKLVILNTKVQKEDTRALIELGMMTHFA